MPLPVMNVTQQVHPDGGGDIIIVEVHPYAMPPVRYTISRKSLDFRAQGFWCRARRKTERYPLR